MSFTDEQIIAKYIDLRDRKAEFVRAHKDDLKLKFDDHLDILEGMMSARLAERGAKNTKTSAGTAYKTLNVKYKVADSSALLSFVRANEAWNLISIDTIKAEVEAYVEAHGHVLPPGVDATMIESTNFRKA